MNKGRIKNLVKRIRKVRKSVVVDARSAKKDKGRAKRVKSVLQKDIMSSKLRIREQAVVEKDLRTLSQAAKDIEFLILSGENIQGVKKQKKV